MSLPTINLDDRHFQDIVDEAKKRIGQQYPEWSDHNVSDPGIMLVELFAWMTEMILYRLNQVPQQALITFLDKVLGVKLAGPTVAKTEVTFELNKPAETVITIPVGTEVATMRTGAEEAVPFTTDADATIHPAQLGDVYSESGRSGSRQQHALSHLNNPSDGQIIKPFSAILQNEDAFYIGLTDDLSNHLIKLSFTFRRYEDDAANIPDDSQIFRWEAKVGETIDDWERCEIKKDSDWLQAMTASEGSIMLHLPPSMQQSENRYWIRCRVDLPEPDNERSPAIISMKVESWGITVPVTHGKLIKQEEIGLSDGTPGQQFTLKHRPLPAQIDEAGQPISLTLTSNQEGEPSETWKEVPSFAHTTHTENCFVLDRVAGVVRFGPAIRLPEGKFRQFGKIPPPKARLTVLQYRVGGGAVGNVGKEKIDILKTSNPFIARVVNRRPATGGIDAETLEAAIMRGLQEAQTRRRAVTKSDFEFLGRQILRRHGIDGRVYCLPSVGNQHTVRLFVLNLNVAATEMIDKEALFLKETLASLFLRDLERHTLLTTQVELVQENDIRIRRISTKVYLKSSLAIDTVALQKRLHQFFNPGAETASGQGVRQDVHLTQVIHALHDFPVTRVEMFDGDAPRGMPQTTISSSRQTQSDAVTILLSGQHQIIREG